MSSERLSAEPAEAAEPAALERIPAAPLIGPSDQAAAVLAPAPLSAASSRPRRAVRVLARAARTTIGIGLFAAGATVGVLAHGSQAGSVIPTGKYPPAVTVPEPAAARVVADAIVADDAPRLADLLGQQAIERLAAIMTTLDKETPIVEVSDATYLGTLALGDQTVSGYVARGVDPNGQQWIIGFGLRVVGREVIGVN